MICIFFVCFISEVSLSSHKLSFFKQISGPGLKNPEARTIEYLEEVAVDCARGIADKRIPLTKEKGVMQSMCPISVLFHCLLW